LHKQSLFFYEKYFNEITKNKKVLSKSFKIDAKDKLLLKELVKNSRVDCVSLSKKVNLTAPAVAQRIKLLESSGIIQKYSLFIDISKLNLFQYSVFIENKYLEERLKLISALSSHKSVSFIAEYTGNPLIEFGIFVNDPYEFRKVLQGIEEVFPNNQIIEVSMFQKEFVSIGAPDCVFD